MTAAELQKFLKEYQIEKERLKRLDKSVATIMKETAGEVGYHIQLSEVVPDTEKNPFIGDLIQTPAGYLQLAPVKGGIDKSTKLKTLLGMLIGDIEVLDVVIYLCNKQRAVVEEYEAMLRASDIQP